MQANDKQVAGTHYKQYGDLQPWDVVLKWKLGYLEGTALKYIARWRDKGGIDDIKKAIHFLEKLVETETQNGTLHNQKSQLAFTDRYHDVGYPNVGYAYSGQGWMEKLDQTQRASCISGFGAVQLQSVRPSTDQYRPGSVPNSDATIPHWGLTQEGKPLT